MLGAEVVSQRVCFCTVLFCVLNPCAIWIWCQYGQIWSWLIRLWCALTMHWSIEIETSNHSSRICAVQSCLHSLTCLFNDWLEGMLFCRIVVDGVAEQLEDLHSLLWLRLCDKCFCFNFVCIFYWVRLATIGNALGLPNLVFSCISITSDINAL